MYMSLSIQDVIHLPRLWAIYDTKLNISWRAKTENEAKWRLQLAKQNVYYGKSKCLRDYFCALADTSVRWKYGSWALLRSVLLHSTRISGLYNPPFPYKVILLNLMSLITISG